MSNSAVLTFVIATRNGHKVEEIRAVLLDRVSYRTLTDFPDAPAVVEDAGTFAGNATKKAVELARWLGGRIEGAARTSVQTAGCFCLADDSGLEVDALNGAPGVHSARFAALDTGMSGNSSDADNNAKLLRLLSNTTPGQRTARFRCVLALVPVAALQTRVSSPVCYADETELTAELFDGVCEGRIIESPRGGRGFGYDPLFVPKGYSESFGELPESTKNRISHRAQALAQLQSWLQRQGLITPLSR
jgi:XTP/dITP diphosphohydrolase